MNKPARNKSTPAASAGAPSNMTLTQAQALTRQFPHEAPHWRTFASILLKMGELAEARGAAQRARELEPDNADSWVMLGEIETQAERDALARDLFKRALQLDAQAPWAHFGLAKVSLRLNDRHTAQKHIDEANKYWPNSTRISALRAIVLNRNWRNNEAGQVFSWLLEHDSKNGFAHWSNLGNVKRDLGRLEEAETCYRNALKVSPKDPLAHSNLVSLMHYMPGKSREDILEACKNWGTVFMPERRPVRPVPDTSPGRPLRIGMFSDGFRMHPVGAMTIAALEHLVGFGYEIYTYTSSPVVDALTRRMQALSSRWTAIGNSTDEQFAARVRQDEIDILIDLAGHSSGTRMRAMALEPAPLLVKWVGGLINTTGVDFIDYLITDNVESPPDSDAYYTEKLIRMPDDYICYLPPAYAPEVGALPARRNGYVTFGCFNNPTKVNDATLVQWARILTAMPDSRLFLKGGAYESEELCERVRETLESQGISADRLKFEGDSHHPELLGRYNEIDIALDPWPYSGGLTTCEALLMGVPVITLPGPTFAGRHSATHLANVGLPEFVVSDWDEYLERTVGLAKDLDLLETLRGGLRGMLESSPVCDGAKYARHLADALRAIWHRYCSGKSPASLAFTPDAQPWFEDESAPITLNHPIRARAPSPEAGKQFRFQFDGKVVALDHGGGLASSSKFEALTDLASFEIITIDPASRLLNAQALRDSGRLQHYHAHIALGDGSPTVLHACLDTRLSGTLEPLPAEQQASFERKRSNVLARLSLPSTRLDDINGLTHVDWLLLDNTSDSPSILNGASQTLGTALVVEVGLRFVPLYKNQPELSQIEKQLAEYGLRLLRLADPQYHSGFPETSAYADYTGSQLVAAKAIFIPTEIRVHALEPNQQQKLAFLLDAAYGCVDQAFQTLRNLDELRAQAYLSANLWTQAPTGQIAGAVPNRARQDQAPATAAPQTFEVPSVPHMEPEGQAMLSERLKGASVFLEYGSGGSSVQASSYPLTRIFSVDSDEGFLRAVADKVKVSGAPDDRYVPIYADIGPTGAWGHPTAPTKATLWPRYVGAVWETISERQEQPDLILIDGRFRVASFLMSAMMAPPGCIILFDDYFDRPAYHVVERFISPARAAGRMAEFVVPARQPEGLLPALMRYCTIPT